MAKKLLITAAAVPLMLAAGGCSIGHAKTAAIGNGKMEGDNVALATRAHLALAGGRVSEAVELAERAVERSPNDGTVRSLLGNAYLSAGRFASAEAAYADALTLSPMQPEAALRLALSRIAQGKRAAAIAVLGEAQGMLDPADAALALALAGRPEEATGLLEQQARAIGADARVRQNLALAYALAGNWEAARTVASQDLDPGQVQERMAQWMEMAAPEQRGAQVASLIGVVRAASDPGQPVRLALKSGSATRVAVAPSEDAPQSEGNRVAVSAAAELAPAAGAPVQVAEVDAGAGDAAVVAPAAEVAPPVEAVPAAVAPTRVAVRMSGARPALSVNATRLNDPLAALRGKVRGEPRYTASKAVVQLGSFKSPDGVRTAWRKASARYSSLRNYRPASARFNHEGSLYYRLGIRGFGSDREARAFCQTLRQSGQNCFVRAEQQDVKLAMR